MRVLHCPTTVAGNPQALAKAEREIGLDSTAIAFNPSGFGFETDETAWEDGAPIPWQEIQRWKIFARAATGFDVVHFNFGQTIFPQAPIQGVGDGESNRRRSVVQKIYGAYKRGIEQLDLPILKALGKTLAVTFQGSDGRHDAALSRYLEEAGYPEAAQAALNGAADERRRRRIEVFDRHADLIYALNPDLLQFLPERAEFLPYASVDPRAWMPVGPDPSHDAGPLIVHAPTNRVLKGSGLVLDAVDCLREEGHKFRFRVIEDLPHEEAKTIMAKADILVDQLVLGWYGAVSVEFMAMAKPVVCYIRESDLEEIPAEMRGDLPLIQASPRSLEDILRTLITDRKTELASIGKAARAYVERWHDPRRIAKDLRADYEANRS